tara:strand:+ start:601 stop:975 length:375 start_codon:yes stop_codon:yes gene_type:complete
MNTKPLTKKAAAELERSEAIERLRTLLAGDDKPVIHTITRHVSASGMTRDISLIYANSAGLTNITYSAALALGWTLSDKSGNRAIKVEGAGMDMGFHTVYTLSRVLYRDTLEGDAGYKLQQAWL